MFGVIGTPQKREGTIQSQQPARRHTLREGVEGSSRFFHFFLFQLCTHMLVCVYACMRVCVCESVYTHVFVCVWFLCMQRPKVNVGAILPHFFYPPFPLRQGLLIEPEPACSGVPRLHLQNAELQAGGTPTMQLSGSSQDANYGPSHLCCKGQTHQPLSCLPALSQVLFCFVFLLRDLAISRSPAWNSHIAEIVRELLLLLLPSPTWDNLTDGYITLMGSRVTV